MPIEITEVKLLYLSKVNGACTEYGVCTVHEYVLPAHRCT